MSSPNLAARKLLPCCGAGLRQKQQVTSILSAQTGHIRPALIRMRQIYYGLYIYDLCSDNNSPTAAVLGQVRRWAGEQHCEDFCCIKPLVVCLIQRLQWLIFLACKQYLPPEMLEGAQEHLEQPKRSWEQPGAWGATWEHPRQLQEAPRKTFIGPRGARTQLGRHTRLILQIRSQNAGGLCSLFRDSWVMQRH